MTGEQQIHTGARAPVKGPSAPGMSRVHSLYGPLANGGHRGDAAIWQFLLPQSVFPGQDAVLLNVPEDLCQVPEEGSAFPVVRRLEEHHQVPEGRHGVRDPRKVHLQQEGESQHCGSAR